jgi:hypothetical protein
MEKVSSFGLILMLNQNNLLKMYNIIKVIGGEDFLMVKVFIRNVMVNNINYLGDLYKGSFKNGLKHGVGSEKFGNRDYYKG